MNIRSKSFSAPDGNNRLPLEKKAVSTAKQTVPTVVLADDHEIFREGLKAFLRGQNIANVIGEASNGKEFLELLKNVKPDLVIMDIHMPVMDGLEATCQAMKKYPELNIIAYTMFDEPIYRVLMESYGVKRFLKKASGIEDLERAIRELTN